MVDVFESGTCCACLDKAMLMAWLEALNQFGLLKVELSPKSHRIG